MRARHKIESESRPRSFRLPNVSWKTVVPALSMAALVMVILLNPFSGHLQTVEEVVAYSIANHFFCVNPKANSHRCFLINQNDVAVPFDRKRKYIVEEGDIKVTLWEESGVVYAMVI